MDEEPIDFLIGLAQHTPPEARGDPGATYHLVPQEKQEHLDGLDDGSIPPVKCVREHAGGENYVPSESNNDYYNVGEDKVMGYAREGFLDDNFNEYLIPELKRDHPDTRYIHKVLDNHTDKAGQAPTPGPYRSRIGFSMGTDVVRRPKGPILEKSVNHLGITEDPLYHDDGRTRVFYRTSLRSEKDKWLRENVLDKPGFYLPKNMQRRLRGESTNLQHQSIGASNGSSVSPLQQAASRGSDSELVTSHMGAKTDTAVPIHQSSVSNTSLPLGSLTPNKMSAAPAADHMDVDATTPTPNNTNNTNTPPAGQQQQQPPSGQAQDTATQDRARLSGEYQQLLEKASSFVKTPGLTDMSKDDAVDKFVQIYKHRNQLAKLQDQLRIPREQETELEIDTRTDLDSTFREMGNKLIEEIKASNILSDAQKPLHISGVKTNPLLNVDQLVSVHANANAMSNQREAQRVLSEQLAEAKRNADVNQKKSMDEVAEMKRQLSALSDQLSESKKRPREETFDKPLPGADASPGSLLKKNRTDDNPPMSNGTGGNNNKHPASSNANGVKVGNFELPQRFSTGASAGTMKVSALMEEKDHARPVAVTYRHDLHQLPPGEASRLGLTMNPIKVSASQREYFDLLNQKHHMLDQLALVHNDRVHTLREPIGRQQSPY
jgi:hypothetical protein